MGAKIKQLQPSVEKVKKVSSKKVKNKQVIKRLDIKDSPFQVVTIEGESFGTMGKYRLTEKKNSVREVKEELEAVTWNRIIQVILLLGDINKSEVELNKKKKSK